LGFSEKVGDGDDGVSPCPPAPGLYSSSGDGADFGDGDTCIFDVDGLIESDGGVSWWAMGELPNESGDGAEFGDNGVSS
jgi:hypothetical protein